MVLPVHSVLLLCMLSYFAVALPKGSRDNQIQDGRLESRDYGGLFGSSSYGSSSGPAYGGLFEDDWNRKRDIKKVRTTFITCNF